jgi:hypothetical protein
MTNDTNQEPGSKSPRKPNFIAYSVRDRGEGKDSKWTEIGVAFQHKDGKGLDILFEVVPLSGRITLRIPTEKKA